MKGLTYYENYKAIMEWMDGGDYLPPPIECNLDPHAECNLNCYFCITQRYLKDHREEIQGKRTLDIFYTLDLIDFLAKWGVRGLCVSGGGEPTLHRNFHFILKRANEKGMKTSVFTNGTMINPEIAQPLMRCQWVAVSVDAGDWRSYETIKGKNLFDHVVANIGTLTDIRKRFNSDVSICYKFLVLPENQHLIYKACRLAKELGCQDFHARPVDFERKDVGGKKLKIDKSLVMEQYDRCHKLENDDFRVYTITHKFDPEFHVMHQFKKCLASPLVIPILTDMNAYLCVDKKMEEKFKLGSCNPPEKILEWWGSDAHRDLVKSVNVDECSRCTWGEYNRQIEETVIKDNMCVDFP
jgi:MoaA/NifB/PqqE/SkfB family radical SAM enzyme